MELYHLAVIISLVVLGYGETTPQARIIGGVQAAKNEFPYLVSIKHLQEVSENPTHSCGGVIISKQYIVTAAQCVHNLHPANLIIIAGEHHLYEEEEDTQTIVGESYEVHNHFNANTLNNDIAIIKLSNNLKLDTNSVKAVEVAGPDEFVSEGTVCQVAGWGASSESGVKESILRKANVNIVSHSYCEDHIHDFTIRSTMICAGTDSAGFCFSDEGGPLVCNNKVHGVVSFGEGCGQAGVPGVYTELTYYNEWMHTTIRALSEIIDESPNNATSTTNSI